MVLSAASDRGLTATLGPLLPASWHRWSEQVQHMVGGGGFLVFTARPQA